MNDRMTMAGCEHVTCVSPVQAEAERNPLGVARGFFLAGIVAISFWLCAIVVLF